MLSPRIKKIFRDLWKNRGRNILVIIAITIGITGISGITFAYSILLRELDKNYMMTNPASASIYVKNIDEQLIKEINNFSDIKTVEIRGFYEGRIEISENVWKSIWLFVIDDFNNLKLNKFTGEEGSFNPKKEEILIERASLSVANLNIGRERNIIIPGNKKVNLKISGIVHDPGLAPGWMENLVYGYISKETLNLIGEKNLNEINIITKKYYDYDNTKMIINKLTKKLENKGYIVTNIVSPKPGKHPHATQLATLLFVLQTFGLLALILSSVLIINLISSMISEQIKQIGIMKAIGAKTYQIIGIYLGKVIFMSLVSIIIAIPLAELMAKSYSKFAAYMLNFEIFDDSIPLSRYLFIIFIGLFIPVITSIFPIIQGSIITVKDALSDYGIGTKKEFKPNSYLLNKIKFISRPMLLGLRNIFRKKARMILTLSTLAVGGLFFMASLNAGASIKKTIKNLEDISLFDFNIRLKKPVTEEKLKDVIKMIPDIKNYEGWGLYKGNIINQNESFGNRLTIFGIKRNTNMIKPVVRTGRWLVDNDKNEIVVNHLFFEYNPEYKLNDDIILKIKGKKYNFKIVGMAVRPDPSAIFINYDYLVSITDDKNLVSNILVDTPIDIFKDQLNVMKNIEKYFFDNDIFISSSMMVKEFVKILEDHFLIIVSLLMMMSFFIVIVGGLGLITTMSIQVIERTREIGILKAIGASNHSIIKTILIEGFVIGIISWIIAIIFSVPASMLIGYILGMTFFELPLFIAVNPLSIFIWLGIILSFSTISSFIPAFKAVKLQVRDTLGYE